ncbi:MAG: hypothetical protein D6706_20985 [Chloroflexi bacterium]|nr:MAG: hypothetical protein D6706_20985 [Chloroflexota bacterium]
MINNNYFSNYFSSDLVPALLKRRHKTIENVFLLLSFRQQQPGRQPPATAIWDLVNESPNPNESFFVSARQWRDVRRRAQLAGLVPRIFCHSHPADSDDRVSDADIQNAIGDISLYGVLTWKGEFILYNRRGELMRFDLAPPEEKGLLGRLRRRFGR